MHAKIDTSFSPFQIEWVVEATSTNSLLRERMQEESLAEFRVIAAENQTAGRGQRGNSWESEGGKNLSFSLLLRPTFLRANASFPLSEVIALALVEELSLLGEGFSIKWPNDIYWNDKKVAGILIENTLEGHFLADSIVGIGLNVNQRSFSSDAPNPISLYQIVEKECERETLLKAICGRIHTYYLFLLAGKSDEISARYHARLFRGKGFHTYRTSDELFSAEIVAVRPSGHLVLRTKENQERIYAFKEVSFVL